jgi:hypothetical protein
VDAEQQRAIQRAEREKIADELNRLREELERAHSILDALDALAASEPPVERVAAAIQDEHLRHPAGKRDGLDFPYMDVARAAIAAMQRRNT